MQESDTSKADYLLDSLCSTGGVALPLIAVMLTDCICLKIHSVGSHRDPIFLSNKDANSPDRIPKCTDISIYKVAWFNLEQVLRYNPGKP